MRLMRLPLILLQVELDARFGASATIITATTSLAYSGSELR